MSEFWKGITGKSYSPDFIWVEFSIFAFSCQNIYAYIIIDFKCFMVTFNTFACFQGPIDVNVTFSFLSIFYSNQLT